jgi:hypothetical protein
MTREKKREGDWWFEHYKCNKGIDLSWNTLWEEPTSTKRFIRHLAG